ncbi:hypothetical protein MWU54_15615 [Marivita sp. S6314]|uniref:hypothetical protein n=1 Tax=Marivita sp. S6314 TaxID=2926406 RepID=UPI001FF63463|nr:hypothetical protein [Marivita sp. S6314]MCK0151470.1 hypothetical protein [Marivita sp. S6314]
MIVDDLSVTALWWAVIFSGFYHGINPGMGWPLAVSAALMERKHSALPHALALLALGHFLSMLAILLPFSMMVFLVDWELQIRLVAGLIVVGMGVYLLINRRHPRFLARVHPARLALWSFLAALAHGAGLMLVPIFLGLCGYAQDDVGHEAAQALMTSNIRLAFLVAAVHTFAMTAAGAVIAVFIYIWLGLKFLSKAWFNLDILWAISLVCVGCFGIYSAFAGH